MLLRGQGALQLAYDMHGRLFRGALRLQRTNARLQRSDLLLKVGHVGLVPKSGLSRGLRLARELVAACPVERAACWSSIMGNGASFICSVLGELLRGSRLYSSHSPCVLPPGLPSTRLAFPTRRPHSHFSVVEPPRDHSAAPRPLLSPECRRGMAPAVVIDNGTGYTKLGEHTPRALPLPPPYPARFHSRVRPRRRLRVERGAVVHHSVGDWHERCQVVGTEGVEGRGGHGLWIGDEAVSGPTSTPSTTPSATASSRTGTTWSATGRGASSST